MRRYFTIYKTLLRLNLSSLLAYRMNFINSVLSSLLWGSFSILTMYLLTARTSSVYDWTRNELLLLVSVYNVLMSIFHMLFTRNFERFSRIIHKGEMDVLLIKPLDSQLAMSFWYVNFASVLRILMGIVFTYYILSIMKVSLTPASFFFFLIFVVAGIMIMYSIWFMISTIMIWYSNLSNLVGLLYEINGLTRYPAQMFRRAGLIVFSVMFPLTFVVITPTKTILQKAVFQDIFFLLFFAIILLLLSRMFWKFALRFYTSASG